MIKVREIKASDRGRIYEMMQQSEKFKQEQMVVIFHRIDHFLFDPDQIIYKVIIAEDAQKELLGFAVFGPDLQSDKSYQIFDIVQSSLTRNGEVFFTLLKHIENELTEKEGRIITSEISSHSQYQDDYDEYLKQKYVVSSRIYNFYSVGEDKIILSKNLSF